ncbi:hypothetical protein COUCH_25740 [Couchioplanes caeruleus]|uniref:hypothetical protein n=1 Tax=Couchioplanes caeruleus TaxID=56438 RepID=UPI0020C1307D|nr:hypothetical protein [Couchioplanes caeruleus]UQU62424.1 hypothetical protein COUCH_25740 [Couchioplanes caeruleus]
MRVVVGVLAVAGLALGVQAPARAAPPDPAKIEAVTEIQDDMWPIKKEYTVGPGEVVPAPLGVQSVDSRPVRGLVAQVEAGESLEFARRYRNCWYTLGSRGEMAWCSFDAVLAPYRTLAITAPMVAASAQARPGAETVLAFRWQSRAWADARGGVREVVDYFAVPGAPVVAGTGALLTLEPRDLPTADIRTNGNHVQVRVAAATPGPSVTPTGGGVGTPSPTPSDSPSATPTATGTPTTTGGSDAAGGSGAAGDPGAAGGLPVTGPNTAAVGAVLLAAGLIGYLSGRRRRNRFES